MNNLSKQITVFLATIVIIGLGTELYYRYINKEVLGNTGSLSYARWSKKTVRVNQWGFRDKQRSIKKADPNTHRVLVIGPSNIFGQGVTNLEDRLTEKLETMLNQDPEVTRQIEVINCGTMTLDTIGTAMKILANFLQNKIEFDSVVIYYSWNNIRHIPEVGQAYYEHKKKHYKANRSNPVTEFLAKNSYAYDWLSHVSKDKSYKLDGKTYHEWHFDYYRKDEYFKKHIAAIKSIDKTMRLNNKKLFMLVTPISYKPEEREQFTDVLAKILNSFRANQINTVDVSHIYEGIPEMEIPVSKYDGHNKPKYYTDMVEILVKEMKRAGFSG